MPLEERGAPAAAGNAHLGNAAVGFSDLTQLSPGNRTRYGADSAGVARAVADFEYEIAALAHMNASSLIAGTGKCGSFFTPSVMAVYPSSQKEVGAIRKMSPAFPAGERPSGADGQLAALGSRDGSHRRINGFWAPPTQ